MTDKVIDFEQLIKRLFQPETVADRELMWTALGFFAFGAIMF